ncbi:addiction module toxin, RelE/StbE family [Xenococcus sp. PCC 7305]|uniref:type II toxin-antitoxin system RelE/ParE family toxin n=1 Tax=Xenococcus sp. PCC 7305 TaxID=102125 RepID=UPI0002ABCF80|nr:type II toxin-antitoxin system mRNA interferase toxin, RelE/StbE family [Xenococcus sp. PCC 7305]ELS00923.1 addiction module toxin, RelE/StbE family [Xenococcus sp. PCC 7305]
MIKVSFSSSFRRIFKKKIKGNTKLESRFWTKLEVFTNNPFDPSLRTHKLSGKLKDLWSFSVEYDQRIIFYFKDEENVVLIDIGNHDQVY